MAKVKLVNIFMELSLLDGVNVVHMHSVVTAANTQQPNDSSAPRE